MNTPTIANGMLWPGMARGVAVCVVLADAWAEQDGADQSGDAAGHVHDAGAGEVGVDGVTDVDLGDQAATPGPVDDDRVDDRAHERR